ncbi:MAG: pseudouridine synthase, partial [Patescibacteria group bacterium]
MMKNNELKGVFNIHKPLGISPLDTIKTLKENHPELKDEKMTYAGRLDPMAEGVLLILAGKAVHKKEKYLKLDKEYEGEILFGFETDTYDILGLSKRKKQPTSITVLDGIIKNLEGEISLPLPPYSSYKIKGKPLFQWAREG